MRGPLNWLELIKKVPGWAKTAIGFITVIAIFIVAFRENWYLYSTVTIILILLYILWGSIYVISARKPSKSKKKKWNYKYEKQRPWGFVGLALVGLSALGLLSAEPTRQVALYAFLGTPTPTPPPQLESADVLIAEFDSRYASHPMVVAQRLESDLEDRLHSFGMDDVNVQVLAHPVASEAEAQAVVNDTGSRVVIWGWYDDAGIQVRVFLSGGEQAGREFPNTHEIPLALSGEASSEITFVVRNVLPESVSFLSLFVIGHLEYLANNFEAGHRAFDAAMHNMPPTVEIENEAIFHFFQARQMDAAGAEPEDVICEYAKAIESDPGIAEPYNNLGVVLSRFYKDGFLVSDIPSQARACLREAGLADERDPDPPDLYGRALNINPGLTIAEYNDAAFAWRHSTSFGEDILNTFERIQANDPSIIGTYIILGAVMDQKGDDAGAIAMYEAGTKVQPDNLVLHFNLGQLYLSHEKDVKGAEKEFQTVLSIDSDDLEAHLALGNLYYGQDKLAEASAQLAAITESTGLDEGQNSVYWDARVLETAILFIQNESTQAIQGLEEIVQATSGAPLESFLLGLLHQSMGDDREARESFQAAEEQDLSSINQTSDSTWRYILDSCYGSADNASETFEDWAMNELPDSDCLPAGAKQRIKAIYEIFHTSVLDRRIITGYLEEGMACPYVYAYDPGTGEWNFQTTILYQLVNREDVQRRPLAQFDGRLLVREEEREISYINQLYVLALLSDGTVQTLEAQIDELKHRDTDYLMLHQGEEILVPLAGYPPGGEVDQWWVVAAGYYEPIDQ